MGIAIIIFLILPASIGAVFSGGDVGRRAKAAALSVAASICAIIILAIAKKDGDASNGLTILILAILIFMPYFIGREFRDHYDKKNSKISEESRIAHRDAHSQETPYKYKIGRHAKETLALRYGVAHIRSENGRGAYEPEEISIKKLRHLGKDRFEAELTEYGNRTVIAVIEPGTDYVKTFYPKEGQDWWKKNKAWEEKLKGNQGFTIKDMARMHFDLIK